MGRPPPAGLLRALSEALCVGKNVPLLGMPIAVQDLVDVAGLRPMCATNIDPGPGP